MNHDERGLPGRWNAPGRRTRCGVVAVVLAAILAGGILASGPAAAAPTIPDGGIRVKPGPPGDVCAEVRLAAQAGFPYVSFGSGWEGLEPSPGDYRDPATERAILSCAKGLGLKTFLVLTGAPEWASGRAGVVNDPPTPANVPAYGAFLSQLAGRLGPLVNVWAVWNEPNLDLFWAPPHDAGRYVQIQQTGYAAIKGADPTSLVATAPIVGASSGSQTSAWDYIEAAYRAGLKGSADLILMNYYPRGAPEGTATDSRGRPAPYSLSSQPYLRSLVNRFDPGRPLWITETSYSTCNCNDIPGNQVSESQQADYLVRVFLYRRRYLDGVTSRIFWYELRDKGPNRSDWFANQGIVRNDFSLKPAFAALSAIQSDEAPAGGGGGGTPFTLPRAALRPPAPSSRVTARGIRLRLGKPRVVLRRGRITLAVRAGISAGRGVLRVQGFRRNSWRRIAVVRLRRSAIVRVRFRDKGYLGVRVLLTTPGQGVRSGVARVVRLGPAPPG